MQTGSAYKINIDDKVGIAGVANHRGQVEGQAKETTAKDTADGVVLGGE